MTDGQVENWGCFDDKAGEFVLTTPHPPRAWRNMLFNVRYKSEPDQAGAGVCYRRDPDGTIVLLNWSGRKAIYLCDEATDTWISLGWHPICHARPDVFRCRYGRGYHIMEQEQLGLRTVVEIRVPPDGHAETYRISVADTSGKARRLRLVAWFDIDLNVTDPYFGSTNRYLPEVASGRAIVLHNRSHRADRAWNAVLAADREFDEYAFERSDVLGSMGSPDRPEGLFAGPLPKATDEVDEPSLAGGWSFDLPGKDTWKVEMAFGNAAGGKAHDVTRHIAVGAIDTAAEATVAAIARRDAALQVSTPDATFNRFVNTWIPHQLNYTAWWNRGWAKGFRDGMQDAWAWVLLDPDGARAMIADALPHQYPDGRAVRKWAPLDRKEYNDGPAWLAMAAHAYVAQTGDAAFLSEPYGFLESDESADVLEHLRRGMAVLHERRGARGLCLMPYGDWNDQLTGPGAGGQGESVWTTMALAAALPKVGALAAYVGRDDLADWCTRARRDVVEAIQTNAWNGQWFDRATSDAGRPLGHPDNEFGRIFLLPQAWAILADLATDEQRESILSACDRLLQVEHGYLLLTPPWTRFDEAAGEISNRRPGVVENGANYCHASAFHIAALARASRVDEALDTFTRVLPTNPLNPPSRSRQEPFSITNTYRGPAAGRTFGRSMFAWRTGSAGWLYRDAVEEILGVRADLDGLYVARRLPTAWGRATLERTYRGRRVLVVFVRTGEPQMRVDGTPVDGGLVPESAIADGTRIDVDL